MADKRCSSYLSFTAPLLTKFLYGKSFLLQFQFLQHNIRFIVKIILSITIKTDAMLTKQQIDHYHQQGYLVIDQLFSQAQIERLKQSADDIVQQWQQQSTEHIFSTNDNDRSGNDFFLDSAEEIRCFFEEEAFNEQGELTQAASKSINKIAHALHALDPTFEAFSHQAILGTIAQQLGLTKPQIRQSMYIFKQPRIGGVVNWHQDASFFYTTPQSVTTFWFAIEDATLNNGCLWVEPKGHLGPLRERFNLTDRDTSMIPLNNQPWPDEKSGIPVEVKAGSLVVFHGLLPHYSAPNRSEKSRQAYTLHVTDGQSQYAEENWLQPSKLPLKGFNNS